MIRRLDRPPEPSLFRAAISTPQLMTAWQKVWRNGGGPGGDGVTLHAFARTVDARLARLSRELEAGTYRPGPLRRLKIPKRAGGMRQLAIPCLADRIAQGAMAMTLTPVLEDEFEPTSFAYRPGRSVRQAVDRVATLRRQGYGFVVDADIKGFFDSVPHAMVLDKLRQHFSEPPLIDLVRLWLESFSDDGRGLAQGSPLSPLLSNLYLDALDELFEKGPVRIVRFADDFVLLCKSRDSAEAALTRATDYLTAHGLKMNAEKTRIVPFERAFSFLGHLFVRSIVLQHNPDDATPVGRKPDSVDAINDEAQAPGDIGAPYERARAVAASAPGGSVQERSEGNAGGADHDEMVDVAAAAVARAPRLIHGPDHDIFADFNADREPGDFTAGLAPLYVFERGRRLVPEGETFCVRQGERRLLAVPAARVGRIDLGPDVEADDAALRLAAAHGIPVSLLDGHGNTQAMLSPAIAHNARLHLAQAAIGLNPEICLAQARLFAAHRIGNARALLKRLDRRRKNDAIKAACDRMKLLSRKATLANGIDLDQLRAIEGEGAKHYWEAYSECLLHGFALTSRRGTASRSAVNVVLDFTASLLTRDMRAAVMRAGLHPGFGTLHASDDFRDACVYDLVEAFRAPLAEALTVYLFNNRFLAKDDFSGDGALRLASQAARTVVQSYETWLARPIKNPATRHYTTWRGLLLHEARGYARALRDDTRFQPFKFDF